MTARRRYRPEALTLALAGVLPTSLAAVAFDGRSAPPVSMLDHFAAPVPQIVAQATASPNESGASAEKVPADSDEDLEVTFWNTVKDSNDPAMLRAYLEKFPQGTFAALARIMLEKFEATTSEDKGAGNTAGRIGTATSTSDEAKSATTSADDGVDFGIFSLAAATSEQRAKFSIPETTQGVLVAKISEPGTAPGFDLAVGDVIVEIDHKALQTVADAEEQLAKGLASGRKAALIKSWRAPSTLQYVAVPFDQVRLPSKTADPGIADTQPESPTAIHSESPGQSLKVVATLGGQTGADGLTYGLLGAHISPVDKVMADALSLNSEQGVLITEIVADGAAMRADLRTGDIALAVNGRKIIDMPDFVRVIRSYAPDSKVELEVWRPERGVESIKQALMARSDAGDIEATVALAHNLRSGALFAKDEWQAASLFRKAAEAGHAEAMNELGAALRNGIGVTKNLEDSVAWFRRSADAGDVVGMAHLGLAYQNGWGTAKDDEEAARWYRKSSDGGNIFATTRLGILYEEGKGVAKNSAEAARLFQVASDKGSADATTRLAWLYGTGNGVAKDETRASELYKKAADNGEPWAMYNLGLRYRYGQGLRKDETQAVKWVIEGLKKAGPALANSVYDDRNSLSLDTRKWLQRCLRDAGFYDGAIDGKFGAGVKRALEEIAKQG